jgi:hypothetical protein
VQFTKLEHAVIHSDVDHLEVKDAVVLANGDSVVISEYPENPNARPVRVDRLIKADVKVTRGAFAFSGVSEYLLNEVQVPKEQALVTIRINKWRGCQGCR